MSLGPPIKATALGLIRIVSVAGVLFCLSGWIEAQPASSADLVFLNGKILTVDARNSIQSALAIRGERIVAVGSDAEISLHIGDQTQVIRLDGKTVVPGLIETHCHAIGVGQGALTETYAELSSIAEVQEWIRRRAKELPPGQWITVPRNELTRLKERCHPSVAELDAACRTHPVLFTAATKHALNSPGWQRLGITRDTQSLPGIEIIRDEAGNPRLLKGGDGLLRKEMPPPVYNTEQTRAALLPVLRRYNEVGITGIFERASNTEGYQLYRKLRERGELTVRVTLTFRQQMSTAEQVEQFVSQLGLKPREGDDWVKAGPLKITVDGGIHWGTTYLSEPYGEKRVRFYALSDASYRGDLRYTVEQMQAVFSAGHRLGWQMSCHITGDAGVERVLDALEAADATSPVKDRRFTLIHAYFPTRQTVQRAHRLGVCVDTQSYLYYKDSDALAEIYGPRWAEQFIGVGDWLRGGVPVAINADHMIGLDPDHAMNSFNPFLALYIAVSRKNDHGRVYGAHQKLSRLDALRCVTANAAYLSFDEKKTGSLEPGKLADFVVLDHDYLTCPEEDIRLIKPLRTVVGGKTVYQRK